MKVYSVLIGWVVARQFCVYGRSHFSICLALGYQTTGQARQGCCDLRKAWQTVGRSDARVKGGALIASLNQMQTKPDDFPHACGGLRRASTALEQLEGLDFRNSCTH